MTAAEIVFWAALGGIGYPYLGYPVLIAIAARVRPARPVKKAAWTPRVSIVIVAHDEEENIGGKIASCLETRYPEELREILVVSDGSRDRTEDIVSGFAGRGVRLLRLPGPRGKAASLNEAVPLAQGEILVFTDARQRLDRDAIAELVASFADPSVGAVSGELHLSSPSGAEGLRTYWSYEKLVRRWESRFDSTVGVTGALYALRRELFRPLDPRSILDDVVIPMRVVLAGYRVVFEPKAAVYDRLSESGRREFRRKVRTLAGNFQLVALHPELVHPFRNRLCWQLVSHKLARLAVPWLLVALFAASLVLASAGRTGFELALGAQTTFYFLAGLGALAARGGRARWLSLPYGFALLNLAAAAGLVGFLRGTEKAAWKRTNAVKELST